MKSAMPFEIYDLSAPGGPEMFVTEHFAMAMNWAAHMERGADCGVCGQRLAKGEGWRQVPAIVAVAEVPAEISERPMVIVSTLCGGCFDDHGGRHTAVEALCKATAEFAGIDNGELVLPSPQHETLQ